MELVITCDGNVTSCPSLSDVLFKWTSLANSNETVRVLDDCQGPHCNPTCPETIFLGYLTPYWGIIGKVLVLLVVLVIVSFSITIKIILDCNFIMMNRMQKLVIEQFEVNPYKDLESEGVSFISC